MSKRARGLWLHVSQDDHGDRFQAVKRPPVTRTKVEPLTPRICVSDMVAGCLSAVLLDPERPAYLYRTVKRLRGYQPQREIWDSLITGEHWLWPPVEFERFAIVPASVVRAVHYDTKLRLKAKGGASARMRCLQFLRAVEAIEGSAIDCEKSKRFRKIVNTVLERKLLKS